MPYLPRPLANYKIHKTKTRERIAFLIDAIYMDLINLLHHL